MKKSVPVIFGAALFTILLSVMVINFTEQKYMDESIIQIEQMEGANLIVLCDELGDELFRYSGDETKEYIESLLPVTTFGKKDNKIFKDASKCLYRTIGFYDNEVLIGKYEIYRLDESILAEDIRDRIMSVDDEPSLIFFNNRYWSASKNIKFKDKYGLPLHAIVWGIFR